jgi:hypothetical protein
MSSKSRVKFGFFIAGLVILVVVAAGSISLLASFVSYFQQGADPASIFRGHTLVVPEIAEARWLLVDETEGKAPSRAQQEELIAAYWLAWEALGRAHQTGDPSDLLTYWAGAAYDHALASIDPAGQQTYAHTGHRLTMHFFSEDGSVAAFQDDAFVITQQLGGEAVSLQASAQVVMTLDQGFWRIRQITLDYHL